MQFSIGRFLDHLSAIIHAIFPCIAAAADIFLGIFTVARAVDSFCAHGLLAMSKSADVTGQCKERAIMRGSTEWKIRFHFRGAGRRTV